MTVYTSQDYGNAVYKVKQPLREICVTECCAVVISTAFAMGAAPISIN